MRYFLYSLCTLFFAHSMLVSALYDESDEVCYKKPERKIFVWNEKTVFNESKQDAWSYHDRAIDVYSTQKSPVLTDDQKRELLSFAVEHSNEKLCATLLARFDGIDLNKRFNDVIKSGLRPTLLSRAQTVPIAQLLIHKGANSVHDKSVLCASVFARKAHELVPFYCRQGAPLIRDDGNTVFHVLAWVRCDTVPPKPVDQLAHAICETISDQKFLELMDTQRDGVCGKGDKPLTILEKMGAENLPETHARRRLYAFLRDKMACGGMGKVTIK